MVDISGQNKKRLGDILVEGGAITAEQLQSVLERQKDTGKKIGQILIEDGIVSENKVAEVLSVQLKIPLVSLARYRPDVEALKLLPQSIAEKYLVMPLSVADDGSVAVAMADPLDLFIQDELSMIMNRDIRVNVAASSDIVNNVDRLYNLQQALNEAIFEVVVEGEEAPTQQELYSLLRKLKSNDSGLTTQTVRIMAEVKTTHELVIRVIDAVAVVGFDGIRLETLPDNS